MSDIIYISKISQDISVEIPEALLLGCMMALLANEQVKIGNTIWKYDASIKCFLKILVIS